MVTAIREAPAHTAAIPSRAWYGDEELELVFPTGWEVTVLGPKDAPRLSSLQIEAGAPVNPSSARSSADAAVSAPQEVLSLTIDGWSMQRIIGARGA